MKIFSLNKSLLATWITLLVILSLGAAYFFIYVPANEERVQEQRFRSLQNIDRNIHTKIENGVAMMYLLLKAYHDAAGKKDSIRNYIANYPADKFKLTLPEVVIDNKTSNLDSLDVYKVRVNNNTGNISLLSQKMFVKANGDSALYRMSMHFNTEQFIKMLLPANVFDEYIIFSNGKTLYQSFPAGVSRVNTDSLLGVNNGIIGSIVRNFNVGGTEYQLFLQPVYFGDNECVVGGLLTNSRYQREKTQLPAQIVLMLVTLVLIILLSTPWIKLYQMGSKDRLTISDAISTVVIAMLLMSLLFFMFFKYNVPFRSIGTTNEKSRLSESIINAFKQETDSAYHKLKAFDAIVDSAPGDIVNFGKPSIAFKDGSHVPVAEKIGAIASGISIKQLYWLNKNGDEKINWNADTVNGPHGNFKGRPYFEMIRSGSNYLLNNDINKPYYLDQLVSRTTGAFTTVVSIPSRYQLDNDSGTYVAGMSFNVRSLKQMVLPTGFQFALMDNSGKVLYHSDSARNLNENLMNEFSESEKLKSLLEARAEGYFKTEYYSRDYYVYVKPVKNLPYFIVMFEDAGFKETRDTEVYSFTFSCMLFFFGFMVIQMMVTFVVSAKQSFFKKQVYNTSWIGPKASAHRQYNLAIVANVFIIVLLIIYLQFSSFLLYTFILLFSVTFLSLFLNSAFAKRYKAAKPSNYNYKLNSMRWLMACIVVLDVVAIRMLSGNHALILFSFELVAFAIGIPMYLKGDNVLNDIRTSRPDSVLNKWNYVHSFTLMTLTRLIVSSGIPVMFFYVTAYNYEQHLDIRYKQLQFGKQVINKLPATQLNNIEKGVHYQSGVYVDSSWVASASIIQPVSIKDSVAHYTYEDNRTIRLLNLFRLHISDKSVNDDKFYNASAADSSFYSNHILATERKEEGAVTIMQTKIPGTYLKLTSADLNYHFPKLFCTDNYCKGLLYWLLLISVLALFYVTLTNIIKKIFTLNIPNLTKWQALDDAILADKSLSSLVFVIGLPGSGKLSRILGKIASDQLKGSDGLPYKYDRNDETGSDVFIADLMNIPDTGDKREDDADWKAYVEKIFDKKNRLVIINHFEYNMQDAFTSRIKLNLLERIMLQNTSRVMILSTIHPVAFLDSVFDHAYKANLEALPGQDLERWHVLLGHYRIVVFALEDKINDGIYTRLEQSIMNETRKTHFLNKMQDAAIKVANAMPLKDGAAKQGDELAFKLQMTAHYFYMYIWQSLTKEEKFLLYDLAEDNLVNSFDDYNLNMLICKGIIVRSDGSLKLFNNGFRNFILTAIGNLEAMKIKHQIRDNGNWNKLKYPLFIIMVAILVFLLVSQQEAYSKIITYAATLATGIPLIMKLFSLFNTDKEKTT